MSIPELIQAMHDAGAPMEAILIAVKAIEDERQKEADRKAKRAAERQSQRAKIKAKRDDADLSRDNDATVERHGGDNDATVATVTPSPVPPRDIINPPNPTPSSSLRSDEPRAKRAALARQAAGDFERFWSIWPNRVGKPAAAKAFLKVRDEAEAIIAAVPRYVAETEALGRHWLHPATFLNQRRWEDEPAKTPAATARAGPAYADNRNGLGQVAEEIWGNGSRKRENPSEAPLRISFNGDREQEPDRRNAGVISGDLIDGLIGGAYKRM